MCLSPDFKPGPDYRFVVHAYKERHSYGTGFVIGGLVCFRPVRRLRKIWRVTLEPQHPRFPRKDGFFRGTSGSTIGPIHRAGARFFGWVLEIELRHADPFNGRWPEFAPRWYWPEYWKGRP